MKARTYTLVIEHREDGGFFAYFPALPGCFVEGISYEGTVQGAEEAIMNYLKDIQENGGDVPAEEIEAPLSLSITVRA